MGMGGNIEREKVVRKMFDGYEKVQRGLMTYMGVEDVHGQGTGMGINMAMQK